MKIYKYVPFETGKLIIESNRVLLNNPKNYNDPFDCAIKPSKNDEEQCFTMIINYFFFKEFSKIMLNKEIKIPFWLLWVRWELKLFKRIMRKNPYYGKMPGFDGIMQFAFKRYSKNNPSFYNDIEKNKKVFVNQINTSIAEIRKNLLISCFSTENNSILMWSHYADNHKGMCIEFDVDSADFKKVKYCKKKSQIDLKTITAIVLGCDYIGEKVSKYNQRVIHELTNVLLIKSKDWKYEKEIRVVYNINDTDNIIHSDGKFFLKMPQIQRVFIGCKVNRDNVRQIKSNSPKIEFISLVESEKEYKLLEGKNY